MCNDEGTNYITNIIDVLDLKDENKNKKNNINLENIINSKEKNEYINAISNVIPIDRCCIWLYGPEETLRRNLVDKVIKKPYCYILGNDFWKDYYNEDIVIVELEQELNQNIVDLLENTSEDKINIAYNGKKMINLIFSKIIFISNRSMKEYLKNNLELYDKIKERFNEIFMPSNEYYKVIKSALNILISNN